MANAVMVGRTGNTQVNGLLNGMAWSGGITFSDPDSAADYGSGYLSDIDRDGRSAQRDGFGRIGAATRATVKAALDTGSVRAAKEGFTVEGFTGLKISYAGGGSGAADLRLGLTSDASTAYGYTPGAGIGGDVWLGGSGRAPRAGNYDHQTVLHELGHALGLKHAHEAAGFGPVPTSVDSLEYTVMTYRPWAGGAPGVYHFETWGAPQTYMMLDIATLQHLYGADFSTNAGNTVYRWTPSSGRTYVDGGIGIDPGGNRIFATVWDGGGRDTYDLSAYATALKLDLRPGKHSVFSSTQLADLGGGPNDGHARGNIFNALQYQGDARSLIENAIGGSGADRIVGNAAANALTGGAGNDRLYGLGGADKLAGGAGADVFVFSKASYSPHGACDRLVKSGGGAAFDLPGAGHGDTIDLRGIDADTTYAGDQAFAFGSSAARGHLWLAEQGDVTRVCGNVDADAAIEFQLAILDGGIRASAYTGADFLL